MKLLMVLPRFSSSEPPTLLPACAKKLIASLDRAHRPTRIRSQSVAGVLLEGVLSV